MAVRIWDPRWLTICAVIRTVHITWHVSITLLYLYWGSSMWRVLACYFLGPLFTDWPPGCYVRCGCIGSPLFSFPILIIWGLWYTEWHRNGVSSPYFAFPLEVFRQCSVFILFSLAFWENIGNRRGAKVTAVSALICSITFVNLVLADDSIV